MATLSLDSAKRQDVSYRLGTDFIWTISVQNEDTSAFNFTGYSANLYIRSFSGSTNLVTFSVGSGITLSSGQILLQKADDDAELAALLVNAYYYELEITDGAGIKKVWLCGKFNAHNNLEDLTPQDLTVTVAADGDSLTLTVVSITTSTEPILLACSDETTDLTTGTAKVTFRMPYAFTLTGVRASVTTAPTGVNLIVDINESGASILSTKLSIDAGEKTSTTAATPAVISDASLADDSEITIDIDQVGSTVAGTGLKVTLIGYR